MIDFNDPTQKQIIDTYLLLTPSNISVCPYADCIELNAEKGIGYLTTTIKVSELELETIYYIDIPNRKRFTTSTLTDAFKHCFNYM